jgi:hypothetical protein
MAQKRYQSNDAARKIKAIEWARRTSVKAAAEKYEVDRTLIRGWMAKEAEIRRQV